MITILKELSPFLAIVVSIIALLVGPIITGRISRAASVAQMREKWIYIFRDSLVELCTEFDMAPEMLGDEGILRQPNVPVNFDLMKNIRSHRNRIRLMVNTDEPGYDQLMKLVDEAIGKMEHGITDYDNYYTTVEKIKRLSQRAIKVEWDKVSTNKAIKLTATT